MHFPVPAVGPWRQIIVVGIVTFANPVAAEPVIGVEVVIDLDVELLAVIGRHVLALPAGGIAHCALRPPVNSGVQAINRLTANSSSAVVSVRGWHVLNQFRDVSRRVQSFSKRIAGIQGVAEYVESLHGACGPRDSSPIQRIAGFIDDWSNAGDA